MFEPCCPHKRPARGFRDRALWSAPYAAPSPSPQVSSRAGGPAPCPQHRTTQRLQGTPPCLRSFLPSGVSFCLQGREIKPVDGSLPQIPSELFSVPQAGTGCEKRPPGGTEVAGSQLLGECQHDSTPRPFCPAISTSCLLSAKHYTRSVLLPPPSSFRVSPCLPHLRTAGEGRGKTSLLCSPAPDDVGSAPRSSGLTFCSGAPSQAVKPAPSAWSAHCHALSCTLTARERGKKLWKEPKVPIR